MELSTTSVRSSNSYVPCYAHLFDGITNKLQRSLSEALARGSGVLFRSVCDVDLFSLFSQELPEQDRQYHNCYICRAFLHRYGNLVTIDESGKISTALWEFDDASPYASAVEKMRSSVLTGRIDGRFLWGVDVWGVPEAGGFTHFWAKPDAKYIHIRRDLTAGQAMAVYVENKRNLSRAISEMDAGMVTRACAMLAAGDFARAEKLRPQGDWFRDIQQLVTATKDKRLRERLLWRAAGTAPNGWCAPRGSAFGAIVADLEAGMALESVKRRHDEKMDPLQYQRPSAPVKSGNIAQAEKLFESLGLAAALRRRFALIDDVRSIWLPRGTESKNPGGVFGHLLPSATPGKGRLTTSAQTITFVRFRRDVLPQAMSMEAVLPSNGNFCAYTTAIDPDAPPILQWDSDGSRNQVAWYVYSGGSTPSQWGMNGARAAKVLALSLLPPAWDDESRMTRFESRCLFVLEGCSDTRNSSLALFPECIRSELHSVRATIEAHSRSQSLVKPDGAHASGLIVGDGSGVRVVVYTAAGMAEYQIDRWE